jgi:hypothetical protein
MLARIPILRWLLKINPVYTLVLIAVAILLYKLIIWAANLTL